MKTAALTNALFPALLAGFASVSAEVLPPPEDGSTVHGDPFTPAGHVLVTPAVVREGVQPDMTWAIEYPKAIPDLTIIVPPGKLVTTNPKPEEICVRIAGVSFNNADTPLPVALWIRVGGDGSTWELIFNGEESDVDPSEMVYKANVLNGTQVDFAARGRTASGGWYQTTWTLEDSPSVAALVNGDPVPSQSPAFTNGLTRSFMTHFIGNGNQVVLGPRDILYLFELDSADLGSDLFDMQDVAVVVTWCKNNNGHGNNLDGVDVSNPGRGLGGPVGAVDPSGWIDDEGKKIKRKS